MRLAISDLDGEISFGTARVPNRKRTALTIGEGTRETVIGYLRDDDAVDLFNEFLTRLSVDYDRMKRRR